MFCSNCGAQLPPNGVCSRCGVPAANMTFNGRMQGQPVTPQQSFYNQNPMYVQYQGPQQGYGQPYMIQENVAIRGIKDPRMVAGIGATIKDGCGSMMMVIVSLLTTLAMIFSYIQTFYLPSSNWYYDDDMSVAITLMLICVRCIPFTLFTIGAWMVTFQGYANFNKKIYNTNSCMHTSGFTTVQTGAILSLIPTAIITFIYGFIVFMAFFAGMSIAFGVRYNEDYITTVLFVFIIILAVLILMIVLDASIISQMAKIKHAINGRNYESISMLLPVLLFIMAALQIISLVSSAIEGEIFTILISAVFAIWYSFVGCTVLYIRSRVNNYICS